MSEYGATLYSKMQNIGLGLGTVQENCQMMKAMLGGWRGMHNGIIVSTYLVHIHFDVPGTNSIFLACGCLFNQTGSRYSKMVEACYVSESELSSWLICGSNQVKI